MMRASSTPELTHHMARRRSTRREPTRGGTPRNSTVAYRQASMTELAQRTGSDMDPVSARIADHWRASEEGNLEAEHAIYAAGAILDYPQSGERFRGRANISAQRGGNPAARHFTVRRIIGRQDLWISECTITYDGVPSHSVSIMEFADGQVVHETQYFSDSFPAPATRADLAEAIPDEDSDGT
jgi:hypothetical protein